MKAKIHNFILGTILLGALFLSCSQEKNTFVSKSYHNVTGRYNGYFLAKERMKLVEENLWDQHADDYNRVLEIYPIYDTTFGTGAKADLDYIYEYASIAPQKHKNSEWVDDSYILLGKVKFYSARYDTANTLLRYVNTKGEDESARHLALILMMRSHLQLGEYRFAYQIHDYLSREKMKTSETKRELNLAFAHFERQNENYEAMLDHMLLALPHIKKKYEKARAHYIIGQLYQMLSDDENAYTYYKKALRGTPPYEIEFFSKLSIAQVSKLDNSSKKKIYKYFAKLLKDAKNEEYKDKIYYEMAKFEFKQGHLQAGFENVDQSIQSGGQSKYQKAYTYLLAAETNYKRTDITNIRRYKLAKAYYDSTVATMNPDWPEYEEITERDETLDEFVKEITIVETEDSLQRMSRMPEDELAAYIEDAAQKEEERLRAEYEAQKKKEAAEKQKALIAQMESQQQDDLLAFGQNTSFPFYNAGMMISSQQKFMEIWGNRPLEDNWRRSSKDQSFSEIPETSEDSTVQVTENIAPKDENEDVNTEPDFTVDRQSYYDAIPKTEDDFAASNERLMGSLYNLGKIYYLKLAENKNAVETFERLNSDYPEHENYAEALYFLFLICEKEESCNSEDYKNELVSKFPHSIYAKLAQNPNYLADNNVGNAIANAEYEQAYNLFTRGYYSRALKNIQTTIGNYPTSNSLDKMHLLRIMCLVKTQQGSNYKKQLIWFIDEFKTSDLRSFAEDLLDQYVNHADDYKIEVLDNYERTDSIPHYVIGVFSNSDIDFTRTKSVFQEFHDTYYKTEKFASNRVDYSLDKHIIVVKEMKDYTSSRKYLDKLIHYNEFGDHYKNVEYRYYIVSYKNYNRLINKKDLDGYREFYKQTY